MKTKALIILAVCTLIGCSSLRKAQVVTHATHDTLYVNTIKYDSVYLYQSVETDRRNDTVIIHDRQREYKYRVLHDTTRIARVDSIPVVHEVEVVRRERYVPAVYRWALGIVVVICLISIIYILWKRRL